MAAHGTRTRYNSGCRCGGCTEANSDATRKRRAHLARDEAPPGGAMIGGKFHAAPSRPVELTALQERAADAAMRAAAVRGSSPAAQSRRERLEAEALAAELLDRQDRAGGARKGGVDSAPSVVTATAWHSSRRPGYTPAYVLPPLAPGEHAGLGRLIAVAVGLAPPITPPAVVRRQTERRPQTPTAALAVAPVAPLVSDDEIEAYAHALRRWNSGQSDRAPVLRRQ